MMLILYRGIDIVLLLWMFKTKIRMFQMKYTLIM